MDRYQPRFPLEFAKWLLEYGCGHYNQKDAVRINRVTNNYQRGLISACEAVYCLTKIERGELVKGVQS